MAATATATATALALILFVADAILPLGGGKGRHSRQLCQAQLHRLGLNVHVEMVEETGQMTVWKISQQAAKDKKAGRPAPSLSLLCFERDRDSGCGRWERLVSGWASQLTFISLHSGQSHTERCAGFAGSLLGCG